MNSFLRLGQSVRILTLLSCLCLVPSISFGAKTVKIEQANGESYYKSRRILKKILTQSKDARKRNEARLALVQLERIVGDEKHAVSLLAQCAEPCRQFLRSHVRVEERKELFKWLCAKDSKHSLCIAKPRR